LRGNIHRRSIIRGALRTVIVLISLILLSSSVTAQAAQSIQVYAVPMKFVFDETGLAPPKDQQGFIYNDTTYLPLRFVVHSLNQAVEWDHATSTVTIREPESQEQAGIDDYNKKNQTMSTDIESTTSAKSMLGATTIDMFKRKVTYRINGKAFVPEAGLEGFIVNDRLFVPLRFVSSSLGHEVDWDPITYSVALLSPKFITSENYILSQSNREISALETSCQNALLSTYLQFIDETDPIVIQELKTKGHAQLAQCDTEFEIIMTNLQSSLSRYGYSTSIVAEYRNSYAEQKALAASALN